MNNSAPTFSDRFDKALAYATIIHAGQLRKATQTPYIAHLLGVTSIALEYGANEDEAIAALLHDAGEDAGGEGRIADIHARFGPAVAKIVEGCTDTLETPKPAWRERKEKYINHLDSADASTILVSAADKLYNTRAILRDLRREGNSAFERFQGKKDGILWYYRALVAAFRKRGESELIDELDRLVTEIELLTSVDVGARPKKATRLHGANVRKITSP
jgi:(p)ppGpp synthase/HD superfamily hydrolase